MSDFKLATIVFLSVTLATVAACGDLDGDATGPALRTVEQAAVSINPAFGDKSNDEGEAVSEQISINGSSPNGTVVYGATGLPTGLSVDTGTGAITGTVDCNAAGSWTVTVSADDDDNSPSEETITWTIVAANCDPTISFTDQTDPEGTVISRQVTASDPDTEDTLAFSLQSGAFPTGLTMNGTGLVSGTIALAGPGSFAPTIRVNDGTVNIDKPITWDVTNVNQAPVFTAAASNQTNDENASPSVTFAATDADIPNPGDTMTWYASGLPPGLSINANNGTVSGTITYAAAALGDTPHVYNTTIVVTDDNATCTAVGVGCTSGNSDSDSFTWTVNNVNRAPSVSSISNRTDIEHDAISFSASATDLDGDTFTWTASGLPSGITINSSSGLISGTLAYGSGGSHSVVVTASDGADSGNTSFTWSVTSVPTVAFQAAPNTSEGGVLSFPIRLSANIDRTVHVDWQTTNTGTATTDSDFTANSGTVTIDASTTRNGVISVTTLNDAIDEDDETVGVEITDATYATLGSPTARLGTINDNDSAGVSVNPSSGLVTTESGGTATFTVVLDSQPTSNVTIAISSSDTGEGTVSPSSLVFTSANWNSARTVTVTGVDDAVDDDDISYQIDLTVSSSDGKYGGLSVPSISATNQDNDSAAVDVSPTSLTTTENGSNQTFTIVLTSQPTSNVTINLDSSDATEGTVSPAQVTFTSGNWSSAQTVTIDPQTDGIDDGNIAYAITTSNASSSDGNYGGLSVSDVTVTNHNVDHAALSINDIAVTETDANVSDHFTVTLSVPSTQVVTVNYATADGSATGGDYTAVSSSLTFAALQTSKNIPITVAGDNIAESSETFTVHLSGANNASIGGADGTCTITDDDFMPLANAAIWTINEDEPITRNLTFTDLDDSSVTFQLRGSGPSHGTAVLNNASTGSVTYTPNSNYSAGTASDDSFAFRVSDGTNTSVNATISIRINPVNDAPTVTTTGPYSTSEGDTVQLTANGTDIDSGSLTYAWDLDNDGSYDDAVGATVTYTGGDGDGSGTDYPVRVRVSDGALTATRGSTVTVHNAPPVLTADTTQSGQEGGNTQLIVNASDPGVDTLHLYWTYDDGQSEDAVGLTAPTHIYADDGTYHVGVRVVDEDGAEDTINITTTITNSPPRITSTPPLFGQEGVVYSYDVEAIDAGVNDVLTFSGTFPPGMTINSSTGMVSWTPTNAQATHDPPVYAVQVTVNDGDGLTDTQAWDISLDFVDTDGGGAPDACEILYGLDRTDRCDDRSGFSGCNAELADPDHDGVETYLECLQGTDPTTSNAPTAPSVNSPRNDVIVSLSTVLLSLNPAFDPDGDVLYYDFELYSDPELANSVFTADNIVDAFPAATTDVPVDGNSFLTENARYYWRANATDLNATSGYSNVATFRWSLVNDLPTIPNPVSPITRAGNIHPSLVVDDASDPEEEQLTYDFEVWTVEASPQLLTSTSGVAEGPAQTSWTVDVDLAENSHYSWRAQAVDASGGASGWSQPVEFQVNESNTPPTQPVILFPEADGVFTDPSDILLIAGVSTDEDADPLTYRIRVATDAGFADAIPYVDLVPAPAFPDEISLSLSDSGFTPVEDTRYYWDIVANDGTDDSMTARSTFIFSATNEPPGPVAIQAPADNSRVNTVVPEFVWINTSDPEGSVLTYEIEVFADEALTVQAYGASGIAQDGAVGDETSLSGPPFDDNHGYFWRIRAMDDADLAGPWSDVAEFFVDLNNEAPTQPVIESPRDGEILDPSSSVTLSWQNAVDPEYVDNPELTQLTYAVEVYRGIELAYVSESPVAEDPSGMTSLDAGQLEPGGYSWRVRAHDGLRNGPYSDSAVFNIFEPEPAPYTPEPEPEEAPKYPAEEGACGCSTTANPPMSWGVAALLVGIALAFRRRRR